MFQPHKQIKQSDHIHILIFYFPIQYSQGLLFVLFKLKSPPPCPQTKEPTFQDTKKSLVNIKHPTHSWNPEHLAIKNTVISPLTQGVFLLSHQTAHISKGAALTKDHNALLHPLRVSMCVLLYPIQSVKNYIQLRLKVCLCHVFNNTKIKAFLSCCCILCSRMPEHWFRHLTLMEKSSPLNLCCGSNIEWNSPLHTFKHCERIKRHICDSWSSSVL